MTCIENSCFYSSFFFIFNAITMIFLKYYVYASLFIYLSLTSSYIHYYSIYDCNSIIYQFEKVLILFIILHGAYLFFSKYKYLKSYRDYFIAIVIVMTFLLCIFLYEIGYFTNQYCFNSDKNIRQYYYSILHIVGGIGHSLIAIL